MDTGYFLRKSRHDKHFFIGTFSNLSTLGPSGANQLESNALRYVSKLRTGICKIPSFFFSHACTEPVEVWGGER